LFESNLKQAKSPLYYECSGLFVLGSSEACQQYESECGIIIGRDTLGGLLPMEAHNPLRRDLCLIGLDLGESPRVSWRPVSVSQAGMASLLNCL